MCLLSANAGHMHIVCQPNRDEKTIQNIAVICPFQSLSLMEHGYQQTPSGPEHGFQMSQKQL